MRSKRVRLLKVERAERIRIPKDFAQEVEWLADQKQHVMAKAVFGDVGGIRIYEPVKFLERFGPMVFDEGGSSPSKIAISRYFDNVVDLKFHFEESRFTVGILEEYRNTGILPSEKTSDPKVVIWTNGSILEIWRALDWITHLREVESNFAKYLAEAEPS